MMWKKSMATMLFVVAASTFPVECAAPGKFMQATPSLDAWVVYWDRENGLAEFSSANAKATVYTGISYFDAYFDRDGKLFLPEGMVQKEKNSTRQYLCVVNDAQQLNETSLKDTDILKKFWLQRICKKNMPMKSYIWRRKPAATALIWIMNGCFATRKSCRCIYSLFKYCRKRRKTSRWRCVFYWNPILPMASMIFRQGLNMSS